LSGDRDDGCAVAVVELVVVMVVLVVAAAMSSAWREADRELRDCCNIIVFKSID
jgi:hypothetical protein